MAASIGISWLALMYIKRKLDPYREEKKQVRLRPSALTPHRTVQRQRQNVSMIADVQGKAGKKASEAKKKHPKLQIVGMEQVRHLLRLPSTLKSMSRVLLTSAPCAVSRLLSGLWQPAASKSKPTDDIMSQGTFAGHHLRRCIP